MRLIKITILIYSLLVNTASASLSHAFDEGLDAGFLMICVNAYPENDSYLIWENQSIAIRSKYEKEKYDENFTLGLIEVGNRIKTIVDEGRFNHKFCNDISKKYFHMISS